MRMALADGVRCLRRRRTPCLCERQGWNLASAAPSYVPEYGAPKAKAISNQQRHSQYMGDDFTPKSRPALSRMIVIIPCVKSTKTKHFHFCKDFY